ncbi:M16 family metallopeptidase [Lederbergia lenta]|uniref:Zinc protease n=1 Tax=Lederbergia lenta TaxID=1467 RepID=A0A2X4WAT9_LEDLE|nr:pitrilysin family protein [Lederbergia lenta]MEC2324328.1 pitrilysin family protein [Lederbergia lenta]SQI60143.1 Zinc protease [Lederbergia lenta]
MIKKHTCQNGVRIVLEEIPTVRSVAIGIWVGTGSSDENEKNNGISHFLEHMYFKGTETRNAREIAESFDSIGGQVNAFTSKEYTCYYAKVLDNHAPFALEILADMFFNSTFDSEELNKEKNVVLEEIKMYEDTPDDIIHDLLSNAVYKNHPLGYPILGTEASLQSFTSELLKEYVHNMYVPENIVISIAGNVKESFIKEIERYFGSFERGNKPQTNTKPIFQANDAVKQKEIEQAHLCIGFEGLPIGHDDVYDLIVMNNIFGGSMSSRLFQEVREEKGLAYSVFSYHSSFKDSGLVTIYGGTGSNQMNELYETIQNTLEVLKDNGITKKELVNSKEQLKGNLMLSLESTNSRMSRNGKNELILGKHRTLDQIIEEIDKVTIDSVSAITNGIFTDKYSVALISPDNRLPDRMN